QKVDREGNQRQPLLLGGGRELAEFPFLQQQLARPPRLVVLDVGLRILGDVAAEEPQLAVADAGVGLVERALVVPQALDFGPLEDDAALELVENVVFVRRLAVAGDDLGSARLGGGLSGGHESSSPIESGSSFTATCERTRDDNGSTRLGKPQQGIPQTGVPGQ